MSDTQLFAFESDFVASLRCIPMAVRLKLDLCGIKLTLRQWSRFARSDREALLAMRCRSRVEVDAYRAEVVDLVASRAGETAKPLAERAWRYWEMSDRIPIEVADRAISLGLAPPSASQWAALTPLQRFALIKLTRDNHDNVNFAPAMREFELAPRLPDSSRAYLASP
jgi:hypothetical protein